MCVDVGIYIYIDKFNYSMMILINYNILFKIIFIT